MSSNPNAKEGEVDPRSEVVIALCHLIMSCEEFKADNNKVAQHLGVAQARNVPRKINSFIVPYGFELKAGKVVVHGAQDNGTGSDIAPTLKKTARAKKTSPTKKRKVEDLEADVDLDGEAFDTKEEYDDVEA